jgi:hypothetical protein
MGWMSEPCLRSMSRYRRLEQPCSSSKRGNAASLSRTSNPRQSSAEGRRRRARAGALGTGVWSTRGHSRPDSVLVNALPRTADHHRLNGLTFQRLCSLVDQPSPPKISIDDYIATSSLTVLRPLGAYRSCIARIAYVEKFHFRTQGILIMPLRRVAFLPCGVVPFRGKCPPHLRSLATAAFFLSTRAAKRGHHGGQNDHPG